jgi:putative inorganic carbon (hco3(-)) transporter
MTPKRLFTWVVSLAIGSEIFSGNWAYAGLPSLDRVLVVAAIVVVLWYGVQQVFTHRLRLRSVHVILLLTATYATVSAIAVGTFSDTRGRFALLDRLGFIPFIMFCLAPIVFDTLEERKVLLKVLIFVGGYLGLIAVLEGVGLSNLVFPQFIQDPTIGIHFGRARGPFLESGANGLAMIMCATAAAIGFFTWRSRAARITCALVGVACLLGTLFTLTRAIWIGAALGAVIALLWLPRARRWLVPIGVVAAVCVFALFQLVPSLASNAQDRVKDESPIWDRLNTNNAAIDMIESRPLFGYGWQTFPKEGPLHMWQADTYPLTGAGLEVHNLFLSHAAELGLIGSLLWLSGFLMAIGGAILRRGPPDLLPWRIGLAAITAAILVSASFSPLSAAFPNLLLWTWAGIVARDHFLVPRRTKTARDHAAGPPMPRQTEEAPLQFRAAPRPADS